MPISKVYKNLKNNLQEFDKYKNYFLIKCDQKLFELNEKIKNSYKKLIFKYEDLILYIYKNDKRPETFNPYKLIYGHFYDNDNLLQFKNVIDKKYDAKIHIGKKDDVLKNELGQPVKHNNFDTIMKISSNLYQNYYNNSGIKDLYTYDVNSVVDYDYYKNIISINEPIKTEFNENENILTITYYE